MSANTLSASPAAAGRAARRASRAAAAAAQPAAPPPRRVAARAATLETPASPSLLVKHGDKKARRRPARRRASRGWKGAAAHALPPQPPAPLPARPAASPPAGRPQEQVKHSLTARGLEVVRDLDEFAATEARSLSRRTPDTQPPRPAGPRGRRRCAAPCARAPHPRAPAGAEGRRGGALVVGAVLSPPLPPSSLPSPRASSPPCSSPWTSAGNRRTCCRTRRRPRSATRRAAVWPHRVVSPPPPTPPSPSPPQIRELQRNSGRVPDEHLVVLVGDMITCALPSFPFRLGQKAPKVSLGPRKKTASPEPCAVAPPLALRVLCVPWPAQGGGFADVHEHAEHAGRDA